MARDTDRLAGYRERRDPGRTPEPVPPAGPLPRGDDDTFVVHEHHARRLHWDLRLERDGVLVSWAVPRGIPPDPKVNRLAVRTEDHPLEYASFDGTIPAGEYGGGRSKIWDNGTYETEKWDDREVKIVLHGARVSGRYVLIRTGGKNWLIHRMDPPADPGAEPLPTSVLPMLAQDRPLLPRDRDRWAFEVAWDGRRLLAHVDGGQATFTGPDGAGTRGPAGLGPRLGAVLGVRPALLDGELATVGGRETYLVSDLLHLDGHPLTDRPYRDRRTVLDGLGLTADRFQTTPWFPGAGDEVRAAARAQGLTAVLAKRLDAPYRPGTSGPAWRRVPVG